MSLHSCHPSIARRRLAVVAAGKNAVFERNDPWPFFLLHHLHISSLLLQNLRLGRGFYRIDFNIGKLIEPAGD